MSGLAVLLELVVIRLWMLVRALFKSWPPSGGPSPGMDSIATQLALLAIDRLTQWAFVLIPHGYPDYHTYLASLLTAAS